MDDLLLMNVPHAGNELGEEFGCVAFAKVAVGEDMVEQFTSRGIFKNDTDVFVGLYYVVKAYDVGMFEGLENDEKAI